MAEFSKINAKAATITGAILGFLCGLLATALIGTMGMSYAGMSMMGNVYPIFGWLTAIYGLIVGAIIGVLIAIVYNWALSLK